MRSSSIQRLWGEVFCKEVRESVRWVRSLWREFIFSLVKASSGNRVKYSKDAVSLEVAMGLNWSRIRLSLSCFWVWSKRDSCWLATRPKKRSLFLNSSKSCWSSSISRCLLFSYISSRIGKKSSIISWGVSNLQQFSEITSQVRKGSLVTHFFMFPCASNRCIFPVEKELSNDMQRGNEAKGSFKRGESEDKSRVKSTWVSVWCALYPFKPHSFFSEAIIGSNCSYIQCENYSANERTETYFEWVCPLAERKFCDSKWGAVSLY